MKKSPGKRGYSYLRFSTPEQLQGDSFRRQTALALEYATRHGLTVDDKLTFQDLGVSAYRGKHVEAGKLGEFLEAVRAGLVPRGSYLLVESLDRISRQSARKALRVLEQIVEEDITVVTLSDSREYTKDSLDSDPMSLMMSLFVFIRANEESVMKSKRVRAAWVGKRAQAKNKPFTSVCPGWLKAQGSKWTVVEAKAAIVRRIFKEYLEGSGYTAIISKLNREGVPTMSGRGSWMEPVVRYLLRSQAVIGTVIPHAIEYVDGKKRRKALEPIPGYYPSIISEEDFKRAQTLMNSSSKTRAKVGGALPLRNLFAGLVVCSECSGAMHLVAKDKRTKHLASRLVCRTARIGGGCRYISVRYEIFEETFLENAERILKDIPSGGSSGEDIEEELEHTRTNLEVTEAKLQVYWEKYGSRPSPDLEKVIGEHQAEIARLQEALDAVMARRDETSGPLVAKRTQEALKVLLRRPLDKRLANASLRVVFRRLRVDTERSEVELEWRHGGVSRFVFGVPK